MLIPTQSVYARAKILLPLATSVSGFLLFATPAFAGIAGSVAPDYPDPVVAGQTGLAAKLTITNSSTAGNAANSMSVTSIAHTPSCGSSANSTCMGADIDTGIFTVHSGTGEVGTACAGIAFTAGAPDSSGKVMFTPGSAVTLGPSSGPLSAAQCIIDFTIDVLKVPTKDASVAAGVQTDQLGSANFQDQSTQGNATASGSSETTVNKAVPGIQTTPSAGGAIGTQVHDVANVTGGSSPSGTVTFNLYGAGDTTCSAAAIFTSTNALSAGSSTSGNFTPVAAGTYHWIAGYSGDANNTAATSTCDAETVVITKASPTISTTPSAGGPIGTVLNDTATLSGGTSPTGNVVFNLYAPSDATCSAAAVYTNTDPSSPYGTTPGFASNAAGVWHWTASYAGDANNNATSSPCAAEAVTTTAAAPSIATSLSATSVTPGTSVHDSATLTGATATAGGTATYTVYTDNACSAGAIAAGTKTVTNGVVPNSNDVPFNTPGTFYWQVAYSGDANNTAATSTCQSEILTVGKFTPSISTTLSTTTTSTSTPVHDSATLSGASSDAGGTATYSVFTNAACTAGMVSAGVKTVVGGVVPDSDPLTFATPGTYFWQVVYSGDAKNAVATSSCTREVLTVTAPPPPPPTGCEVDWKPVGAGWLDFGPIVYLNRGGRLLNPNNPCPLKLPLRFSPGPIKPTQ